MTCFRMLIYSIGVLIIQESRGMQSLEEKGDGRVLVVDGGGSKRCALLGDNIAEMAYKNGWDGEWLHHCCERLLLWDVSALTAAYQSDIPTPQ